MQCMPNSGFSAKFHSFQFITQNNTTDADLVSSSTWHTTLNL